MKYEVVFSKRALKALMKLPAHFKRKIITKVEGLAAAPYSPNHNVKKLVGEIECYRLRVGDYRVLYRLEDQQLMIEIINIDHRREVYR